MSQKQFLKEEAKRDKNIKEEEESVIIGIIKVVKNNFKQRIINSYENAKKEDKYLKGIENEEEIKTCEIFINDKKIDFSYYYEFEKEGKYKIEYSFKNNLTKTCFMFSNCKSLTKLNLSNFNTQNVNTKQYMFYHCNLLISLDLSNFNTKNVTNMNFMFSNCNSLVSVDLSNFNIRNVINKKYMFFQCNSLLNKQKI